MNRLAPIVLLLLTTASVGLSDAYEEAGEDDFPVSNNYMKSALQRTSAFLYRKSPSDGFS
jgi:hypothetical protein